MNEQLEQTGFQGSLKTCSNCGHRGGRGWENGACRACSGYPGGYSHWSPDHTTLDQYIKAIQKDECHFGDTDLKCTPVPDNEYDMVSKPKHYMLFEDEGIEVRDVISKLLDKLATNEKGRFYSYQFAADYVQLMQYLMRFMDKNGKEDLEKALWYLNQCISQHE